MPDLWTKTEPMEQGIEQRVSLFLQPAVSPEPAGIREAVRNTRGFSTVQVNRDPKSWGYDQHS